MDKTSRLLGGAIALALMGGCAHVPNHKEQYFGTTTMINVKVDRTIGCDASNHIYIANLVSAKAVNRADTSETFDFDSSAVSGTFADSSIGFKRTPDGRLLSINETTAGQAGPILQALGTVVAAALAFDGGERHPSPGETVFTKACKVIKTADAGKPITLSYEVDVDPKNAPANSQGDKLQPAVGSLLLHQQLWPTIGNVFVRFETAERTKAPVTVDAKLCPTKSEVCIHAKQPAVVRILVTTAQGKFYGGGENELANDFVLVAQLGTSYQIPVMSPPWFGSGTLKAEFDDSGALTNIEYGSVSGATGLATTISSALSQEQGITAAGTKEINDKSDRIAANERWIICRTTPKDCK